MWLVSSGYRKHSLCFLPSQLHTEKNITGHCGLMCAAFIPLKQFYAENITFISKSNICILLFVYYWNITIFHQYLLICWGEVNQTRIEGSGSRAVTIILFWAEGSPVVPNKMLIVFLLLLEEMVAVWLPVIGPAGVRLRQPEDRIQQQLWLSAGHSLCVQSFRLDRTV